MSMPPISPQPIAPNHPQATTALVVGLIALIGGFMCGLPLLLAPWAWSAGNRALRDIDAAPGQWGGRDLATVGKVTGMVGTALLGLGLLCLVLFVGVFGVMAFAPGMMG